MNPPLEPDLRAPFPYPGGKSRAAHLMWERLGDTPNLVIPFAGSLAELWARPYAPRIETVNDLDPYLANFHRSLKLQPEETARWADAPVDEADLHARHRWLIHGELPGASERRLGREVREAAYAVVAAPTAEALERLQRALDAEPEGASDTGAAFRERMLVDPEFCDPKAAGWWVWGICAWIGTGWCALSHRPGGPTKHYKPPQKRPDLQGGQGSGRAGAKYGRGVHALGMRGGQLPDLGASDKGAYGRGIHGKIYRSAMQLPHLGGSGADHGAGIHGAGRRTTIFKTFEALAARLRGVRVACGDFERVLSPAVTWRHGVTAVILDPPYADCADMYAAGGKSATTFARACRWAEANGQREDLRIVLCGYDGTWAPPAGWATVAWKAQGGYAGQRKSGAPNENAHRERLWFSPHCLRVDAGPAQRSLFGAVP